MMMESNPHENHARKHILPRPQVTQFCEHSSGIAQNPTQPIDSPGIRPRMKTSQSANQTNVPTSCRSRGPHIETGAIRGKSYGWIRAVLVWVRLAVLARASVRRPADDRRQTRRACPDGSRQVLPVGDREMNSPDSTPPLQDRFAAEYAVCKNDCDAHGNMGSRTPAPLSESSMGNHPVLECPTMKCPHCGKLSWYTGQQHYRALVTRARA